jgi:glutamyl-tRNA synthetase
MFHVGGARTVLFNWLYAKKHNGTLVLRIEDTDEERNKEEWVQGILDAITWLGIGWDEGPNRQSANRPKHIEAGERLYSEGCAYYCDCTPEQVAARKTDKTPGYDGFCRDRGLEKGVLRFKVPPGRTIVRDLIRGNVEFDNANLEDFAVVRSNGLPLFNLTNAVDDMVERITHVVRGEEHLPNTPKHILLWQALEGVDGPVYAHLPVIVNEKRQKLSKRRDKVALEAYRDEGFLSEAMRNYLGLLGWAPKGDREIVDIQVMIDEFDLADVQKSSAFFDVKKLTAFNGDYIRALSLDDFITRSQPFLDAADGELWPQGSFDAATFRSIAPLVQERVALLNEVPTMVDFLFLDTVAVEDIKLNEAAIAVLDSAIDEFGTVEWTTSALHDLTLAIGEKHELKLGKAQAPIRLAVTGRKVGPPLFESLELLGRERTITRMKQLRSTLA